MPEDPKKPRPIRVTVVNRHHPGAVGDYVGRGTALGNIFGLDETQGLDVILDRYRWWLAGELANPTSSASVEIARLASRALEAPVNVMCSCAPRRCHADFVREAIYAKLGLEAPLIPRPTPKGTQMALFAEDTACAAHRAFTDLFARMAALDPETPTMTTLVRYQKFLARENLPASGTSGVLTPEAQNAAVIARFALTLAPARARRV